MKELNISEAFLYQIKLHYEFKTSERAQWYSRQFGWKSHSARDRTGI